MSIAFEKSWKRLASAMNASQKSVDAKPIVESFLTAGELNLLAAMPGMVSVHLRNGNLIWANSKFQTEFDIPNCDACDLSFLDQVNPQDRVSVLRAFGNLEEKEIVTHLKRQHQDADGSSTVSAYELCCTGYTPVLSTFAQKYVLATVRNITDTFDNLEEMRSENRALAEKINQQGQFFTAMSHELRTPLNAIMGFSELLEGKLAIPLADDKRVEYASIINESADHLLGLINNVLDLSKAGANKIELVKEQLDLQPLLECTLQSLQPIADQKNIVFLLNIDPDLPRLFSDSSALRQVFTNLVSNAVKFSDCGSDVDISIKRRRKSLIVTVKDQGIGMNETTISKLGNVFFQEDQTIAKERQGSGLGLSIVFNLLKLLDGKINVVSKPNKGTSMIVELPLPTSRAVPVPVNPNNHIVYLNSEDVTKKSDCMPIQSQTG